MIVHTIMPFWVYLLFQICSTVTTFGALFIYAVFFRWYGTPVGRHRFCLYLSVFVALLLTTIALFVGFFTGALILGVAVFVFISIVMVWSCVQMLGAPSKKRKVSEHGKCSSRDDAAGS